MTTGGARDIGGTVDVGVGAMGIPELVVGIPELVVRILVLVSD